MMKFANEQYVSRNITRSKDFQKCGLGKNAKLATVRPSHVNKLLELIRQLEKQTNRKEDKHIHFSLSVNIFQAKKGLCAFI